MTDEDDEKLVRVFVDSRIRVATGNVSEKLGRALCERFEHDNPRYRKAKALGFGARGEVPVIQTWARGDGEVSFPRGGMGRVREVLREHGRSYRARDHRAPGLGEPLRARHTLTLRPYQEQAALALTRRENCLLRAGVGSGKTTVALALAARLARPTLVIVWSSSLAEQWQRRVVAEMVGEDGRPVTPGRIQGERRELRPITIAMQQTLAARGIDEEMRAHFGVVLCDEVQRFAAPTLFAAVDPFPARYRIGISADERRKDRMEFMIHDLFGDAAADIPAEQLADDGHVLEVEVRVLPTPFRADWYDDARRGPQAHQAFHRLLSEMAADERRNALAYQVLAEAFGRGERAFVLSHRRAHCEALGAALDFAGTPHGLMLGGAGDAERFERTRRGLLEGTLAVGIGTYQAIGQGLDVPPVAVAVCMTPIATNRQLFGQVRGRICRTHPGKTSARLYYLHDPHVFGWGPVRNLTRWAREVRVATAGGWVEAGAYLKQHDAA